MAQLFAEKLRHARTARRMTQAALAEHLRLASHAHVANLEAQRDTPSLDLMIGIARTLTISLDYLLRDTIPVSTSLATVGLQCAVDRSSFCMRFRTLRLHADLSQRALAERLGLASRAYIGGLEAGQGKLPSLDLIVRIADVFGVTVDTLFCDP